MKLLITAASAAFVLSTVGAAFAQTTATASTDLNLRAGPGPGFEVINVIAGNDAVIVEGCLDTANWCRVSYGGTTGWAYGAYLVADLSGSPAVIYDNRADLNIASVTYDDGAAAAGVATIGAITGGITGGPAGAVAGAAAGAALGELVDPGQEVITYVQSNPVEPIYLDGEVVVGAVIPETVTLHAVPDSDYSYHYINGVPVLVVPADRTVVRIVR